MDNEESSEGNNSAIESSGKKENFASIENLDESIEKDRIFSSLPGKENSHPNLIDLPGRLSL